MRLNNTSQLAGFAKKADLPYFLNRVCGVEYVELPVLAPGDDLLKAYRRGALPWDEYERRYTALLCARDAANVLQREMFEPGLILLCSEHQPDRCHRRLAAEYLQLAWGDINIRHL